MNILMVIKPDFGKSKIDLKQTLTLTLGVTMDPTVTLVYVSVNLR